MKSNKITIITLGCPKNEVDSEVLAGELEKAGFELTGNIEDSKTIIINTCSFIKDAVKEAISTILSLSELNKQIIVIGCLVSRYGKNRLHKVLPEVSAFFDTYNYLNVVDFLTNKKIESKEKFIYSSKNKRILSQDTFAYVKISEGCDKFCSYCTIPYIKGRYFSRPPDDIIKEVLLLSERGIKEIILVSQSLGDYGKDFKNNYNLPKLIENILKIDSLKWLRLLYLYPEDLDEELLQLFSDERLCNYLDIPIQHIDDDILKRMNRKSTEASIKALIERIKSDYPNIFLRTSLIVGFPGETETQFNKLVSFIKEYNFYNLGCFKFSKEDGTKASKLENQKHYKTIEKRYKIIMETQRLIKNKLNEMMLDKELKVLVEGFYDDSNILIYGRAEFQAPEIDGIVLITKSKKEFITKNFYNVKIKKYSDDDLIGEIIN